MIFIISNTYEHHQIWVWQLVDMQNDEILEMLKEII